MKLSEVLDKYYVMALVGSEMVGFDIGEDIRITFNVDDVYYEQFFDDQEIDLLDHPTGGFFAIDKEGQGCGFIALDGVDLKGSPL